MKMELERVREEIANLIEHHVKSMRGQPYLPDYQGKMGLALQILSLIKEAGYVRLSPDQSLPQAKVNYSDSLEDTMLQASYRVAQQDMLKANWRKVDENKD